MTMIAILVGTLVFAGAFGYLTFSIVAGPSAAKVRAMDNLRRGLNSGKPSAQPGTRPAASSKAKNGGSSLSKKLVNKGARSRLDLMLAQAGRPTDWPLERVVTVKLEIGRAHV